MTNKIGKSWSQTKEELSSKKVMVEMDELDLERLKNYELLAQFFSNTFSTLNIQVNSNHSVWKDERKLIEYIFNEAKGINQEIIERMYGIK